MGQDGWGRFQNKGLVTRRYDLYPQVFCGTQLKKGLNCGFWGLPATWISSVPTAHCPFALLRAVVQLTTNSDELMIKDNGTQVGQ